MANGKRGAPLGNKNAAKGFAWKAAIERCVEAWPTKPDQEGKSKYIIGLETMAYMFVGKMVESRDIAFFREFGDRLDGKPTQQVDLGNTDTEDGLLVRVTYGKPGEVAVVPVPIPVSDD